MFKNATWLQTAIIFLVSSLSANGQAADFTNAPEDLVASYRYLEARSQDFLEKFDQSKDPMGEANYADLIATRILREQTAHWIAKILRNADSDKQEASILKLLRAPEVPGSDVSSLPLVDNIIDALSQDEITSKTEVSNSKNMNSNAAGAKSSRANRSSALEAQLTKIYSHEERNELHRNWGTGQFVRQARQHARNFVGASTLEKEIVKYAKMVEQDVVLKSERKPSNVPKYRPSKGPEGNLTGREFPSNMWAMTFDDGPAGETSQILDELAKRKIKATFFWLSKNVSAYEMSSVSRARKDGHGLANHSATHRQLTRLTGSALDAEIIESTKNLERVFVQPIEFFRLPFGSGVNNAEIRDRIMKAGLVHVYWNVDTLDWQDRNPDSVYSRTMKQVSRQGRGVILFHDIHSQTIVASRRVMDSLRAQGARLTTMAEALNEINGATR
jgi:peptidoglycan/xylan/chitin deacetylase (PgdA/CDA1 family)